MNSPWEVTGPKVWVEQRDGRLVPYEVTLEGRLAKRRADVRAKFAALKAKVARGTR